MTLGDIIKTYRQDHGCSMDAFAAASGLSKAYISMLEKNENPKTKQPITPSIVTFKCVSLATGISIDKLLEQVDENQPIYLVADKPYRGGMKIGAKVKPFHSDKTIRIPSFKIDSDLYDNLVLFAEENHRSLEDEIEWRLYESIEQDFDNIQNETDDPGNQ